MFQFHKFFGGGADKNRTCYLIRARDALSQMSYSPTGGSSGWTRTNDILINSQMFYQLNYGGINYTYKNNTSVVQNQVLFFMKFVKRNARRYPDNSTGSCHST